MIGVGLLGLGEIGQVHLAGLRESTHVESISVFDLDRDLAASSQGPDRLAASLDEMLADPDVSVIDICLPHYLHAPIALEAIAAGKNVLLEKPMAMSVAECDLILHAAQRAGVEVGVSHNQLLYEPIAQLARMIDAGALGTIRSIRGRLAIGGKYGEWRSDPEKAGGGLLMDAGVHRIYVLDRLGGPVTAVTAAMDDPGREDLFTLILEFQSGAMGTIDATYHGPDGLFDDQVEVVGTEAVARVTGCEALFEGYASGPPLTTWRDGSTSSHHSDSDWGTSVKESVNEFCAAIIAGVAPPVSGSDGRRIMSIIQAAYESARSGSRIAVS